MRLRNIAIVYRKETLDTLRDRRTLISMIIVPLLLMPVLIFGMSWLAIRQMRKAQQEVATVMLLGAEHAPSAAERLRQAKGFRIAPAAPDYAAQISNKQLRAAVEFPPGFEQAIERGERPTVKLYFYAGEIKSQFAVRNLQAVLRAYRDAVIAARLAARQLSPGVLKPFESKEENVAPPEKVGGSLFGGFIPYIIIILMLQGAMYPAIDLTAGEKERGTIETILASPVARSELVLGKFFTVLTASVATALLSLASLGGT
ncbi:MAG: ABC transporter permease, partial [Terriglobia bacterium]